jgi:hypothetical protein
LRSTSIRRAFFEIETQVLATMAKRWGISGQTGGIDDGAFLPAEEFRWLQNETYKDKGRALPRPLQGYFLEELFA